MSFAATRSWIPDNVGTFFYLSLLETFFDNMWRSLDGGMSWTNIAPAKGGDKQWFTIDNTSSTGTASNTNSGAPAETTSAAGSLLARSMEGLPG